MNKPLTLGSLFDGSGTFPMMAMLSGIVPVWKSEIEPFPTAVTEKRLPFVKHLGDINSINGAEIEPVDIITFGSPCTDLSVAGKRQGLNAERSGLFFQAIRIIKEMRGATNGKYPRFAVWENVTGAFSSNGGEDFRCVLEELCKIKDADLSVPKPEKWTKSGEIVGKDFSLAYRTFDACCELFVVHAVLIFNFKVVFVILIKPCDDCLCDFGSFVPIRSVCHFSCLCDSV